MSEKSTPVRVWHQCTACGTGMRGSDPHTRCQQCLDSSHFVSRKELTCQICLGFHEGSYRKRCQKRREWLASSEPEDPPQLPQDDEGSQGSDYMMVGSSIEGSPVRSPGDFVEEAVVVQVDALPQQVQPPSQVELTPKKVGLSQQPPVNLPGVVTAPFDCPEVQTFKRLGFPDVTATPGTMRQGVLQFTRNTALASAQQSFLEQPSPQQWSDPASWYAGGFVQSPQLGDFHQQMYQADKAQLDFPPPPHGSVTSGTLLFLPPTPRALSNLVRCCLLARQ